MRQRSLHFCESKPRCSAMTYSRSVATQLLHFLGILKHYPLLAVLVASPFYPLGCISDTDPENDQDTATMSPCEVYTSSSGYVPAKNFGDCVVHSSQISMTLIESGSIDTAFELNSNLHQGHLANVQQEIMVSSSFEDDPSLITPTISNECEQPVSVTSTAGSRFFYFTPPQTYYYGDRTGRAWTIESAREKCKTRGSNETLATVFIGDQCSQRESEIESTVSEYLGPQGGCIVNCKEESDVCQASYYA